MSKSLHITSYTPAPLHYNSRDIRGHRSGRLLVIDYIGQRRWACRCDCGTLCVVRTGDFHQGSSRSCGCLARELAAKRLRTHGASSTPEWLAWKTMLERCNRPSHPAYSNYGGRGITVCQRWQDSFEHFLEDMGKRPGSRYTLDRISNSQGYCKENCRWATYETQCNNKRTNRRIQIDGETKTVAEWSRHFGTDYRLALQRLYLGWDPLDAFTLPLTPKGYSHGTGSKV